MTFDPTLVKLGKQPVRTDPRTLDMASYFTGTYKPARSAHWGHDIVFDMDGNADYGDCVEAAYLHQIKVWCTRAKLTWPGLDVADALSAYSDITGFNPSNSSTDQGTSMLDACKFWKSTGMAGNKIDAYGTVNPAMVNAVKQSIDQFGGLYWGVSLPVSAQQQTGVSGLWTVTSGAGAQPGSWGGHCVPITGYTSKYLYCVTWGAIQTMTWDFFSTYSEEAYCLLSKEWLAKSGTSPSGFSWAALEADLAVL